MSGGRHRGPVAGVRHDAALPLPAGASAGSAGFGLSPVERPGGRGLQGARAAARRKRGLEPRPAERRSLEAGRRYGGGGALPGPFTMEPLLLRLCLKH